MAKTKVTEIALLIFAGIYYLLFLHKGIVLGDEGYYAHIATRILNGQVPYRDFFIQYSPGYFYLIALTYKIFGISILTGRYLTLLICLVNLFLTFKILNRYGLGNIKYKVISFFAVISFGFPLINIMILAWISVMLVLFIIYFYLMWLEDKNSKWLFLQGIFLALLLFSKQNLGIYFSVLFIMLVSTETNGSIRHGMTNLLKLASTIFLLTFLWVYLFFLRIDISVLIEFIKFNKQYLNIYPFSYPPLTFLVQPLGIFKLIPYYLPIVSFFAMVYFLYKKKKNYKDAVVILAGAVGFAGTVFPTSDLLHVYPFFGMLLVGIVIFFYKTKYYSIWLGIIVICIGIGFYLALFREYYRYEPPYRYQNTELNLPRTRGIYVDKSFAVSALNIYRFLNSKTNPNQPVLMYPFDPMLYFIFERTNPSRFSIYYPGYLTNAQEMESISSLKVKHVRYVVTYGQYKFKTPLSRFIQRHRVVYSTGQFSVFALY